VEVALQRSIESLRCLMTDLYPPDLRSGGFAQTITALADRLRDTGIDVQLDLAEMPPLTEEAATSLYRVARESLANVQKHAQASTVQISLEVIDSPPGTAEPRVRLVVADDGVGLDPAKMDRRAEGHLGLRLLADRVASLGGTLLITSAAGEGTTVQAELPLRPGTQ
jgi:two-component system, NarL family, sensor kinase